MAKGTINKVFIVGNVGQEPTIKRNDKCDVAYLSIATVQIWKDKSTNMGKERTDWHEIAIYGKLVNIIDKYVTKSDKVCIVGHLQTNKWKDEAGKEHTIVQIIGEEIQILSNRYSVDELSESNMQK